MKGLALCLELNDDYFHDKFNPAFPMMALWHYPPVPGDSDSWGVGPNLVNYSYLLFIQF